MQFGMPTIASTRSCSRMHFNSHACMGRYRYHSLQLKTFGKQFHNLFLVSVPFSVNRKSILIIECS